MVTLLQTATKAESEFSSLFRSRSAVSKLKDLHADLLKACEGGLQQVHIILDVAAQRLVEKLSWDMHKSKDATPKSVGIPELLDLCIVGATENLMMNHAPYKILEDFMDGQTIVNCEKIWEILETRKAKLTTPFFIPPYDGKVPSTTKASLCLLRLSNTLLRRLSKTHNTVFCGRILTFVSFAFALSERSAVNATGRFNVNNITLYEDEATYKENTDASSESAAPEYSLYKTFWSIQRYFRQPNLVIENDTEWKTFRDELKDILDAFDSNAFNPKDVNQARETLGQALDDSQEERSSFFQTKYLTNSRLFQLQLRDPILRECMLTQFLILLRHLEKTKLPTFASATEIHDSYTRVFRLLEETPTDGKGFSAMVTQVLERENNWTQWKDDKCKPYECIPEVADTTDNEISQDDQPPTKKLKTSLNEPSLLDTLAIEDSNSLFTKIQGITRKTAMPVEDFISRFEEARDPENAMEREYWPDNDKMICWRTMRACMRKRVQFMDKVSRGTGEMVEAILRAQNGEVPAASPTPSASENPPPQEENEPSESPVPSSSIASESEVKATPIEEGEVDSNAV